MKAEKKSIKVNILMYDKKTFKCLKMPVDGKAIIKNVHLVR